MQGALYGASSKETNQGEPGFTTDMLTTGTSRYINIAPPLNQHACKLKMPCHNGYALKDTRSMAMEMEVRVLEGLWPGL